jgi:hypothetical protein
MEKPRIEVGDYWTQCIEVEADDDILMPFEVAEAYEEMIDALIEARFELISLFKSEQSIGYRKNIGKRIDQIEQALKKAGCKRKTRNKKNENQKLKRFKSR